MYLQFGKTLVEIRLFDNIPCLIPKKTVDIIANYLETYFKWGFLEVIIRKPISTENLVLLRARR
jgi:hypothetical protein